MKNSFAILLKSPKFMIGAVLFLLMLALVLIYPQINRKDPLEMIALAFQPRTPTCGSALTISGAICFSS